MPTEIPAPKTNDTSHTAHANAPAFFVVSARKLFLLDVASLGLYKVFWFYRNWQVLAQREQQPLSAFWRALLAGIFSFFLFAYVEREARRVGVQVVVPAWLLALSIIGFSLLSTVSSGVGLLSILMILPVLYVNNVAHRTNYYHDANFVADDSFSPAQRILIAVGAMVWMMLISAVLQGPVAITNS